jgi:hypothetical protein
VLTPQQIRSKIDGDLLSDSFTESNLSPAILGNTQVGISYKQFQYNLYSLVQIKVTARGTTFRRTLSLSLFSRH